MSRRTRRSPRATPTSRARRPRSASAEVVARLRAELPGALRAVPRGGHPTLRMRRPVRVQATADGRWCCPSPRSRCGRCCAPAANSTFRWSRAAPAPACRAARCRTRSGVVLALAKLNRILSLDPIARTARVQPGVRNLAISEAAAPHGLYYAPDPSSQIACTIGGNVAENSGGVHCLKYGLTVHNVLRVRGADDRRRGARARQRGARRPGSRPAVAGDRLRGHAGRGHRGDR